MLEVMRWLVVTIAIGSLLPGAPAWAAPPAEATATAAPAAETPKDPAIDHARKLYREGEARFATADYLKAIELWTEAFTSVPDTSDAAYIKGVLIYNLATAHERAFEITGDISHLRQAKVLMESYAASINTLVPDEKAREVERARITERLNAVIGAIQVWDAQRERERKAKNKGGDEDREPEQKSGKALVGVGAGLLGLGVVGLAVMTGGLVMGKRANDISGIDPDDIPGRRDQFDRGRTGNGMAIGGGVAGGVLLVTGAVLLGIGLSRRAKNKNTAWAPMLAPRVAGIAFAGRF